MIPRKSRGRPEERFLPTRVLIDEDAPPRMWLVERARRRIRRAARVEGRVVGFAGGILAPHTAAPFRDEFVQGFGQGVALRTTNTAAGLPVPSRAIVCREALGIEASTIEARGRVKRA